MLGARRSSTALLPRLLLLAILCLACARNGVKSRRSAQQEMLLTTSKQPCTSFSAQELAGLLLRVAQVEPRMMCHA